MPPECTIMYKNCKNFQGACPWTPQVAFGPRIVTPNVAPWGQLNAPLIQFFSEYLVLAPPPPSNMLDPPLTLGLVINMNLALKTSRPNINSCLHVYTYQE